MTDESGGELQAPTDWDSFEGSEWRWENIEMQEIVYTDFETGTAEAIEEWLMIPGCNPDNIHRVHRLDRQTIEVVWFDDIEDCDEDEEPTKVRGRTIRKVRQRVQDMFGEQWRVERKPDERRAFDEHPQRALIRRADHQRFSYIDENGGEYRIALHGRPDNAPDDVVQYAELDRYPIPPSSERGTARDIYIYDSGTGTKHLIDGDLELRMNYVACEVDCFCSVSADAEDVVDGEMIEHYAEWLKGQARQGVTWEAEDVPDPKTAFGDALCTRCWKSYAMTRKSLNDKVMGYDAPVENYKRLLRWSTEEHDHE